MADKKPEKPAGWNLDPVEAIILLLILAGFLGGIVPSTLRYINSGELSFFGFKLSVFAQFFEFLKSNVWFFKALGFVSAGFFAVATFVYTKKGDAVLREEKAKVYPEIMPKFSPNVEPVISKQMEKWQKIVELSGSTNSSDWRLAIIEADIMLDELLTKLQLPGDTIGEKLKAVEPSDFLSIESAWEAHKARNNIAHEGSDFLLNERETRRIISLYETVFKEFFII